MDEGHPILTSVKAVSFLPLTTADVRAISVLQITNTTLLDNNNAPTPGGLYDPRLGPLERGDICATCRLNSFSCPGHFGHIELSSPVFHPLFMVHAVALLRGTCMYCHRFLRAEATVLRYAAKLALLENGLPLEAEAIDNFAAVSSKSSGKRKAEDTEDGGENGVDLHQYRATIERFVADSIARKRRTEERVGGSRYGKKRDDYNINLCYGQRRQVISEFIRMLPRKVCERCGAAAPRLKKEGHTRVVEYSLAGKIRARNQSLGLKRLNVLKLEQRLQEKRASALAMGKSQIGDRRPKRIRREPGAPQSDSGDSDADSSSSSGLGAWGNRGPHVATALNVGDHGPENGRVGMDVDTEMDDATFEELLQDARATGDVELEEMENATSAAGHSRQTERIMLADEARAHLRLLFRHESRMCSLLYAAHGTAASQASGTPPHASADMFFIEAVPVPPTKFRPAAVMAGQTLEAPQNILLTNILTQTFRVRDLNKTLAVLTAKPIVREGEDVPAGDTGVPATEENRAKVYGQILEGCVSLQVTVNSLMDSTKNPAVAGRGKLPPKGIKQVLEKKEGLFRMNMMGKRVNFAARSVISPDVNIETNEIGVPPVFACKLTFPEFVTPHNLERMHRLVCNGPKKHPGAVFIQNEDGSMISLEKMTEEQRRAQADLLMTPPALAERAGSRPRCDYGLPPTRTPMVNKRVHRHLDDGDILILNRQPTLHKPSMMCHRARILRGEKTIRMHYANCNSYNADFDGDEMNIHFPQNLIAQAEARNIANNDNQYLVPTSGNPLRGLIQDHVVAGVWMTNKDTFFSREDYFQIIYGALRPEDDYSGGGRVLTVPPALWKPQPLWTGKQMITTILKNIKPRDADGLNIKASSKVPGTSWGIHKGEDTVLFVDGQLISGVLDKSQFGASAYGLVHSVYELYGSEVAGRLLSILSRLFTKYLQHRAFSCRMDDLLLNEAGDEARRKLLAEADARGRKAVLSMVGMTETEAVTPEGVVGLHQRLEEVLRDDLKMAGLDSAYGNEMSELSTAVGKCLPAGLYKPFPWNNMQLMTGSGAKGTNVNAGQIHCLLGQQALEGRRVPVMVSGKTLPSFRAFETAPRAGGFIAQRFLTGIKPQEYYFHCMAGREGLIDTAVKTSRSGYLQRCLIKHLEGVSVRYDHTVRDSDGSIIQFLYGDDSLDVTKQKYLHDFDFAVRNRQSIIERLKPAEALARVDEGSAEAYMQLISSARRSGEPLPLPTMAVFLPSSHLGAISEKYADAISKYELENVERLLKARKKIRKHWPPYIQSSKLMEMHLFRSLMYVRFMRALVDPGEAVGLLASQGVGEPSTQMTLNTFHFAGHGAANVTLGIPRLREIIMTASRNIRTPTMEIPIYPHISNDDLAAFLKRTSRLTLSEVIDRVLVTERLKPKASGRRQKLYTIRLELYPRDEYCAEYSIKPVKVITTIAHQLLPGLEKAIVKEIKERQREARLQAEEIGKGRTISARQNAASREEEGAEEEDVEVPSRGPGEVDEEQPDGDADDDRRARQKGENADYIDEEAESGLEDGDEIPEDEEALARAFDSDGDSDVSGTWGNIGSSRQDNHVNKTEALVQALEEEVAQAAKFVTRLKFDHEEGAFCEFDLEFTSKTPKLLLVGMIEKACRAAVIQEIAGISRCLLQPPKATENDQTRYAITEGANLRACWSFAHGVADLDQIYSNDIAALLRVYGVEAARSAIIKEMSSVFGLYGIGVDYRHLTVIADYMTSEGGYKPFNRTGLANAASPFLKASYETTASVLMDAVLHGDYDDLTSPSASIVMGQAPRYGTAAFTLRTKA